MNSSATAKYTDHYNVRYEGVKFSIYTAYSDSPEHFICQISELHPYDDASYAWAIKDQPATVRVIKDGKTYGRIEVAEWDEDAYVDAEAYERDIVEYICLQLRAINRDVKPVMVHY